MARAAADRRPPAGASRSEDRAEVLRGIMADLRLAALPFVAQAKIEETARHWLADGRLAVIDMLCSGFREIEDDEYTAEDDTAASGSRRVG